MKHSTDPFIFLILLRQAYESEHTLPLSPYNPFSSLIYSPSFTHRILYERAGAILEFFKSLSGTSTPIDFRDRVTKTFPYLDTSEIIRSHFRLMAQVDEATMFVEFLSSQPLPQCLLNDLKLAPSIPHHTCENKP